MRLLEIANALERAKQHATSNPEAFFIDPQGNQHTINGIELEWDGKTFQLNLKSILKCPSTVILFPTSVTRST